MTRRPPKFRRAEDFTSFVFKQGGYKLYGNEFIVNKISKRFKFSKSRELEGKVKNVRVFRSRGEWYILVVTDAEPMQRGKTHTGASAGIDFGLKTFMTFSDGTEIEAPQFYKRLLRKVRKWQRLLSRSTRGSNHYWAYRRQLNRVYSELADKRRDWFYQMAHDICRKYEYLFVEDLSIAGMARMKHWGRKVNDLSWTGFLKTLEYVASKYGVTVHKIDRWYPSSKLCDCGYKNDALTLADREWVCPLCGTVHHRDAHAAQNILRRGIAELESI
ncbi:MAG: transposase, partial [Schwartzia sp.]|nr:transposase [Schwartzia sp. (in: firmicutes)]